MKLTYWMAPCATDSHCYSIRARTKKAAQAELAEWDNPEEHFGPLTKVVIFYRDAFELASIVAGDQGDWY